MISKKVRNETFSVFLTCRWVISSRFPSFLTDRREARPCDGYPSSTLRWHTVVAVLRKIRSFSAGHQSIANLSKQTNNCIWGTLLHRVKQVSQFSCKEQGWAPVLLTSISISILFITIKDGGERVTLMTYIIARLHGVEIQIIQLVHLQCQVCDFVHYVIMLQGSCVLSYL